MSNERSISTASSYMEMSLATAVGGAIGIGTAFVMKQNPQLGALLLVTATMALGTYTFVADIADRSINSRCQRLKNVSTFAAGLFGGFHATNFYSNQTTMRP